jgi:hypothetical protein
MLTIKDARHYAQENGFSELLTLPHASPKLVKSTGVYNCGISLLPAMRSGHQVCGASTEKCRDGCFGNFGRAEFMSSINVARQARTALLFSDRELFMAILLTEMLRADRRARRLGVPVAFRPNILSDLPWHVWLADWIDGQFAAWNWYGYTKVRKYLRAETPMHFTYSWSERTKFTDVLSLTSQGINVAIPFFDCRTLEPCVPPVDWYGIPTIDGDRNDLRFLDPSGVIVALRAKLPKSIEKRRAVLRESNGFFVGV